MHQTIFTSSPAFTPVPLQALPLWKQHISKRGFPYQSFTNTYQMKIWIALRCQEEKKLYDEDNRNKDIVVIFLLCIIICIRNMFTISTDGNKQIAVIFSLSPPNLSPKNCIYGRSLHPAEYKIKQMQVDPQTLGIFYDIFVVQDFLYKHVYMKRIAWLLAKPYL